MKKIKLKHKRKPNETYIIELKKEGNVYKKYSRCQKIKDLE